MLTDERLREIEAEYARAAVPDSTPVTVLTDEVRRLKALCGRLKDVIVREHAETAAALASALGVPVPSHLDLPQNDGGLAPGWLAEQRPVLDGGVPVVTYDAVRVLVSGAANRVAELRAEVERLTPIMTFIVCDGCGRGVRGRDRNHGLCPACLCGRYDELVADRKEQATEAKADER